MPEKYTQSLIKDKFGYEYNTSLIVHELSHFWWNIAKLTNDLEYIWIDESLAEYSALSYTSDKYGKDYTSYAVENRVLSIRNVKSKDSIVKLSDVNNDRFVNLYKKTSLLFYMIEKGFGKKKIDKFMYTLFHQYSDKHPATTEDVFKLLHDIYNKEEFTLIKSYLVSPGWSDKQIDELLKLAGFDPNGVKE